ncbi:hypothetical protein HO173_004035 [Letharia columbiana]|uniref:Uncharacterized protein n=1 Tax=Letharia columbiana TaxID=112416 RepID=A0A8H6L711_9LECA|nr:uncharacterized protein HO173_004035 [Letharia columbiana]KAF6237834.1 hypothetical protein HO173_004035 [Letharia columbiana]
MVALRGNPPITANVGSNEPTSGGKASRASQTCDHKCAVTTLSIAIPILSLFIIGILVFGLSHRRRKMRKNKAKDQETEIAIRKLGPESETSSVTGFGDFPAVTNLEDGAEAVRVSEKPSSSWRPRELFSKTPGWWRM